MASLETWTDHLWDRSNHDDLDATIIAAHFGIDNASLELSLHWSADSESVSRETVSKWSLITKSCIDIEITGDRTDTPSITWEPHVLSTQHTDQTFDLYLHGAPSAVDRTIVRLLAVHRAVTKDWIPFERYLNKYLNAGLSLEELIGGGYGQLASGPKFLMEAYERVLQEDGAKPNLVAMEKRSRWQSLDKTPITIAIGESYVVALDFEAERLDV